MGLLGWRCETLANGLPDIEGTASAYTGARGDQFRQVIGQLAGEADHLGVAGSVFCGHGDTLQIY
ncbi:hypothetical protein D3C76_1689530 [compost metagenome]